MFPKRRCRQENTDNIYENDKAPLFFCQFLILRVIYQKVPVIVKATGMFPLPSGVFLSHRENGIFSSPSNNIFIRRNSLQRQKKRL